MIHYLLHRAAAAGAVSALGLLGWHQLAPALGSAASTTRAEQAAAAVATAEQRSAALSPVADMWTAPSLRAHAAPAVDISPGSPLSAAAVSTRQMVVRIAVSRDRQRALACAAAPGGDVACVFLDAAGGEWFARGRTPRASMSQVAAGVHARSSYGAAPNAPIRGYSREGF